MKYDRFPQKRTYINMKNEYHNIRIRGQSTCRVLQKLNLSAVAGGGGTMFVVCSSRSTPSQFIMNKDFNILSHQYHAPQLQRVTQGRDNRTPLSLAAASTNTQLMVTSSGLQEVVLSKFVLGYYFSFLVRDIQLI